MSDLQRVRVWANALIRMHLDDSWSFGFDTAKRRAGACHFSERRITVSRYLAARLDDDEVHQILLHEVAHAVAGPAAGHGPAWRKVAAEIGYVGGRTHAHESATEFARWVGTCPRGHVVYRYRRPSGAPSSCATCSRSFDRRFLIEWRERDEAELASARHAVKAAARATR